MASEKGAAKAGSQTPATPAIPIAQRYTFHRKIRDTILGHIYVGQDNVTKQKVAIKASSLKKNFSGRYMENAIDENRIMEYLAKGNGGRGHPHILRLIEQQSDKEWHLAVYEWLEGGELLDFVLMHGKLSENSARRTFIKLLNGLHYMHEMNICHLDISAENIMLKDVVRPDARGECDLNVKFIDFGLARLVHKGTIFKGGRYGGKVGYMSPEMFKNKDFDPRSADVYAMGVVLFLLATGAAPYSQSRSRGGGPQTPDFVEIYEGRLAQLLQRWKIQLSPALTDLLQRILSPPVGAKSASPFRRLTLAQIFQHPWITGRAAVVVPAAAAATAAAGANAVVAAAAAAAATVVGGAAAAGTNAEAAQKAMSDTELHEP